MATHVRAIWKGYLKIAQVSCAVSLYTAVSTSERLAFHMLNRKTGHRVHRQLVDGETGKPVERDDQVKGYQVEKDEYVVLEPEEISATIPVSNKTLDIGAFIGCDHIDSIYFDRPYYLAPADKEATETFYLIREGMKRASVAAIAQAVLFRRVHSLLIRAHGPGLIATMLNYDYEVRSSADAFAEIPKLTIHREMLDLAKHIIETKLGKFDPKDFDDRYEAALADLVKAKLQGKAIKPRKPAKTAEVVDLMDALRRSAGTTRSARKPAGTAKRSAKTKTAKRKSAPAAVRRKAS
ncbi:MAG TPA: Ku protein [Terriglobia bacterium]|nr:Ku protein [Terriglobia bacterium]